MNELERLSQAIEHLETQRMVLGDQVVDTAMIPLQEKIAEIETQGGFPEQQRKQVTILFTDIVASTRVASHLDPEDTRDIIDGTLQRLAQPIAQHRGHVTRFTGDGFKAVFGTPQAYEDDPEQAVHAGLAILDTTQELAKELHAEWGIQDFQVRVGINTGLVAVGGATEAEDTVMGSTVNLAKRIEDQAPPNGLLISHDTYRHIRGIFDVELLEPITAKGFDQKIPVYHVLNAKERSFRIYTRWVEGIETRMVGREGEFKHLKTARKNLISSGQGEMITISGEAGIGKSRLLFEYRNWENTLPDFVRVFLGRGRQDIQNQPYAMWRDLFAHRFEIFNSDSNETVIQKLEGGFGEIFGQGEPGRMRAHFIGQLLGFDCSQCAALKGVLSQPGQLREQATNYLLDYFAGLADIEPVVILIEDLHWVDDRSLDLINTIGSITPQTRLLIICVTRTSLFERHPSWGSEQDFHTLIKLHPLSTSESKHLVDEVLQKVDCIPDELRDLVVSHAEGNPFYIEELIKMLIENQVILPGEGTWQVEPSNLTEVQVPATLTGVLQARLDSLPAGERCLLQLAAVIGKDFWDQTIKQVGETSGFFTGLEIPIQTEAYLPSLLNRELIFDRGESTFRGTREYSFKHIMFRDVTYESIPKRDRRVFHGLTADWMVAATQANERSEEYAAVIADHYLKAGSMIYASDWFYRAGLRAREQVALQESCNYLAQAMELLPENELEKRWLVQLERDEIVGILGDTEARRAADQELLTLAREIDDDNLRARAYHRQAYFFNSQGDYQNELAAHEKALAAARSAENRFIETSTLGLKVVCLTRLGEIETAQETADLALNYARKLGDDDILAKVLGNVFTYYHVVDISHSVQLIEESVQILDRLGDRNMKATSMINLGYIYTQSGYFQRGVDTFNSSLEIAKAIENPRLVAYNQLNMGLAYYRLGDHENSYQCLAAAQINLGEINDTFAKATCQTYLGLNHEATNQFELAVDCYAETYAILTQVGAPGYAMDALAGSARCALEMGNMEAASQYSSEICEYLEKNGSEAMEFSILAYLTCARVFEKSGDQERRQKTIDDGYQQLMERAEMISDQEWRNVFLEKVPEHLKITEKYDFIMTHPRKGNDNE
ncbi:MAG: AAA family ATPase [Anaerolineales bacterium]|nr:AAA family ATPase [Anaerolineales bacterium]